MLLGSPLVAFLTSKQLSSLYSDNLLISKSNLFIWSAIFFTPQRYKKKAIYANISQFLFTFHQIPCKLGKHHKTSLGLRWGFDEAINHKNTTISRQKSKLFIFPSKSFRLAAYSNPFIASSSILTKRGERIIALSRYFRNVAT